MKTIKIIDLLNKIANGEELPKLKLEHSSNNDVGYELYMKIGETNEDNFKKCLNEEIEIIEEEKEIEKLKTTISYYINYEDERLNEDISCICKHLISHIDKINELTDAVNELKRGN